MASHWRMTVDAAKFNNTGMLHQEKNSIKMEFYKNFKNRRKFGGEEKESGEKHKLFLEGAINNV
jgi:hypothetical protein